MDAPNIPILLSLTFGLTTLLTLVLFMVVLRKSVVDYKWRSRIFSFIVFWLVFQATLAWNEVYAKGVELVPPAFVWVVIPPLLVIISFFVTVRGRRLLDRLDLYSYTHLHVIRIPVEFILYGLFVAGAIPELMTFSGRNFDILAGLTAPLVAYFGIAKGKWGRKLLLGWNVLSLALLLNIVGHAIVSFPTRFQQLAFDQPNVGLLYFPFIWLPSFVVPVVLLGHLVAIRRYWKGEAEIKESPA